MRSIGKGATALLAAITLGAAVLGVRSIPDMQRYLRIRQM